MKQLYIIVAIFFAISVVTIAYFQSSGENAPTSEIVLTVNGKQFSRAEVDTYFSGQFSDTATGNDGHHGDVRARLQAFAEERVLIQEAERLAIDQQQDFRNKIQRYYEYSLISALRNLQEQRFRQDIAADNQTLAALSDHFLDLYGRMISFRLTGDAGQSILPFEMIPNLYKPVLVDMQPGETRQIVVTGNTPGEITLIAVGEKSTPTVSPPDRETIKQQLIDYRTGVKLNEWITALNSNASITYAEEH